MIDIKDAFFHGYMPDMPVHIGDVEVQLSFFISQSTCQCILGQSFEAATQMMRITKNDGSVRMAVFDLQDPVHAVFQPYTPGSATDQYEYETVQRDSRQKKD